MQITATPAAVATFARIPQPQLRDAQREIYSAQRAASEAVHQTHSVTPATLTNGVQSAQRAVELLLSAEPTHAGQDLAGAASHVAEGARLLTAAANAKFGSTGHAEVRTFAQQAFAQFDQAIASITFGVA
ncbi:MAG: hypothetical protein JWO69_1812 [Thermoleophilia bacterium]|nr:hypothetical protein [Thermoleophilia bacterium]